MFLAVGQRRARDRASARAAATRGILRRAPVTGVLLLRGAVRRDRLAAVRAVHQRVHDPGRGASGRGTPWLAVAMLALLAMIFVGMAAVILGGGLRPAGTDACRRSESVLAGRGPVVLLALVLLLGSTSRRAAAGAHATRPGASGEGRHDGFDGLGLRNRRAIPLAARAPGAGATRSATRCARRSRDGWRLVSFFGMPEHAGATRLVAVLAQDERGRLGRAAPSLVDGSYPALTPDCPGGTSVRARDRRAVRRRARGAPVAQAGAPPSAGPRGPAGAGGTVDREAYPFFQIDGRGGARGRGGPGARRHHRAGALPLPGPRRGGAASSRSCSATSTAASSACSRRADRPTAVLVAESIAGDTVIGHASAALRRDRGAGAEPQDARARRPSAASRSSSSASRTTSATSARSPATSPTSRPPRTSAGCAASASTCS